MLGTFRDFVENCVSMRGINRNVCATTVRMILNSEKMRGRDLRNKLYPNFQSGLAVHSSSNLVTLSL